MFSLAKSLMFLEVRLLKWLENNDQKYPGVHSRRLSSIVGFVEMWHSLEIRIEEPTLSGSQKRAGCKLKGTDAL